MAGDEEAKTSYLPGVAEPQEGPKGPDGGPAGADRAAGLEQRDAAPAVLRATASFRSPLALSSRIELARADRRPARDAPMRSTTHPCARTPARAPMFSLTPKWVRPED